jgi:hypothetical protein
VWYLSYSEVFFMDQPEFTDEMLENLMADRSEEDVRKTAEKACASAVAYEHLINGVEYLSIEETTEGPWRLRPRDPLHGTTATMEVSCKLASRAWEAIFLDDRDTQSQAELMMSYPLDSFNPGEVSYFLPHYKRLNQDQEKLREAWSRARRLVTEQEDIIREAADALMARRKEGTSRMEGEVIRRFVSE